MQPLPKEYMSATSEKLYTNPVYSFSIFKYIFYDANASLNLHKEGA